MEGDPCGEIGKDPPTRPVQNFHRFTAYRLESQLRPIYSKNVFERVRAVSWLGLYFSGTEWNDEGLMRFVMNPGLRRRFPDDDECGRKWIEEGRKIE